MAIARRDLLRIVAASAAATTLPSCATNYRAMNAHNKAPSKASNKAPNKAASQLVQTVAYCGLICGVCKIGVEKRCKGCRNGGGTKNCYHRKCCIEKGHDGCWQCREFPCDNGYYANSNKRWRGLCIASAQCAKDCGLQSYVEHVVSRLGKVVDHRDYQYRNPQEIKAILCGD